MIMANCCLFNEIGPKSMESIPRINSYKLKTPEMEKIIFVIDAYCCNLNLPILYKLNTRLGDLHVVFCAIEVIEKMKDGSGLDHLFEEA